MAEKERRRRALMRRNSTLELENRVELGWLPTARCYCIASWLPPLRHPSLLLQNSSQNKVSPSLLLLTFKAHLSLLVEQRPTTSFANAQQNYKLSPPYTPLFSSFSFTPAYLALLQKIGELEREAEEHAYAPPFPLLLPSPC